MRRDDPSRVFAIAVWELLKWLGAHSAFRGLRMGGARFEYCFRICFVDAVATRGDVMGAWTCAYCSLLNDDSATQCASCGSRNSSGSRRAHLLKLPKISLSGALHAIDSALVDIGILPAVAANSSRSSVAEGRTFCAAPASPTKVRVLLSRNSPFEPIFGITPDGVRFHG
ncbi:unnamed protein product [Gongylonema pulchrum]|uniref:RanBP2-type domain-containing protein n=1 Tax=Gongylonema pulchrum TaxID=637853 RepID=A0A183EIZ3_9BILA|nr:unnamed protein product [Gongylonema pulchrum]